MSDRKQFPWYIAIITAMITWPFFYKLFPIISTKPQKYHDIIIENVARSGFNKSGELNLFWFLLFLGIIITVILFLVTKKFSIQKKVSFLQTDRAKAIYFSLLLLLPNLSHFFIYQKLNRNLFLLFILYFIYSLFFPVYGFLMLSLSITFYYAFVGLFTLLCLFNVHISISPAIIGFFLALVTSVIFVILKKTDLLYKLLLWMQLPVLFTLSIYFVDKYLYRGQMITLRFASGYYFFFICLLLLFFVMSLRHVLKHRKIASKTPLTKLINVYTVMTIFIYNSFSACPMYAQPDQHHHGEQMIPWNQVLELGRSLYDEYTPVSGLFPMVIGFLQHILLGGTASDYSPAVSIMMVIVCAITMYLLYKHLGGFWCLMIAMFFCLPCYNRQYLVLPLLLLLFLPSLRERKLNWILVWIFGCFLSGLYYPLFGAALLLGTLPYGLFQCYSLFTNKELKFNLPVLIKLALVFLPILFSIPLLLRILKHTLTFSSQTVLADGICLFGQTVPENFMPYLGNHAYLQSLCYFGIRFFLPLIGVWLFICFLLFTLQNKIKRAYSFFALAGAITLGISYTYTLVRADTGVILSRTSYILCSMVGIFLTMLILSYQKETKPTDSSLIPSFTNVLLLALLFSLPMVLYNNTAAAKTPAMWIYPNGESELLLDDEAKIYNHYEVPELFTKSEDTGLKPINQKRIGEGFIVSDQLSYISHYQNVIEKCEQVKPDTTYMGFDGQGFYYFNNVKACATGFIQAAKGYDAQQEILDRMKVERPVVFLMEPDCTYYVYYWMHTNDYVYRKADECFYPIELFHLLYPDTLPDDYREYCQTSEFGLVPDSFGKSMDTLKPLMTDSLVLTNSIQETDSAISLISSTIAGKALDMLYLELDTAKIIEISNTHGLPTPSTLSLCVGDGNGHSFENAPISCNIADGTLLIPVGMQPAWLLTDNITDISLTFPETGASQLYKDCVKSAILYKIRQ